MDGCIWMGSAISAPSVMTGSRWSSIAFVVRDDRLGTVDGEGEVDVVPTTPDAFEAHVQSRKVAGPIGLVVEGWWERDALDVPPAGTAIRTIATT